MLPKVSIALLSLSGLSLAAKAIPSLGPDGKYTLMAPGITAKFIPYAACITNLIVPDRNGTLRDVILGYDNAKFYPVDPDHSDHSAVPGHYVNRIKDHTYVLNGTRYFTEANDGNGTLHSGTNGWSYRTWNVSEVTDHSITFTIRDEANSSLGFPSTVIGSVTHSTTPSLPFSTRVIGIDENTQSTSGLPSISKGSINDFWSKPK
ncbi:galactose mutarotase-like protein [Acephala macrosclerotiorum]|nr:galactose mutarotase-like protein [Acephala macrosclerotiorum]